MEVLQRFARGDLDAFETIFREHQREVYGWILRIVRDPGVAEDLTIETFWRMYRARARFDPNCNLVAWARRIATNVALDYLRRPRPEAELPEVLAAPEPRDPLMSNEARLQIQRAFRAAGDASGHGNPGPGRRAFLSGDRRVSGHFNRRGQTAGVSRRASAAKTIARIGKPI